MCSFPTLEFFFPSRQANSFSLEVIFGLERREFPSASDLVSGDFLFSLLLYVLLRSMGDQMGPYSQGGPSLAGLYRAAERFKGAGVFFCRVCGRGFCWLVFFFGWEVSGFFAPGGIHLLSRIPRERMGDPFLSDFPKGAPPPNLSFLSDTPLHQKSPGPG